MQSVTVRRNRNEGFMDFRLSFRDASGETYKLCIGDVMAQSMFAMLGDAGYSAHDVGRLVWDRLRDEESLYLWGWPGAGPSTRTAAICRWRA
mgnify:CR=1 FL=1